MFFADQSDLPVDFGELHKDQPILKGDDPDWTGVQGWERLLAGPNILLHLIRIDHDVGGIFRLHGNHDRSTSLRIIAHVQVVDLALADPSDKAPFVRLKV